MRIHGFLADQDAGGDTICNNAAVADRIVFQQRMYDGVNVLCRQLRHEKLFPGQAARRVHLAGKGGMEGPCPQYGNQGLGSDVHGREQGKGQQQQVIKCILEVIIWQY